MELVRRIINVLTFNYIVLTLYRNKYKHDDVDIIDESSALVVMKPNNIILMIIDDICDEVILKEGKLMTIKVTNLFKCNLPFVRT